MTSRRAASDTYEVIASRNMYLSDDSIMEAIGMGPIIVEVMVKGKIEKIRIKYVFSYGHVASKFALNEQVVVKWVESAIQTNECIVRGPNGEMDAIGLYKGNLFEINISKLHRADVANLVQLLENDGAHKFGHRQLEHLIVKHMYALQSLVSNLNRDKVHRHTCSSICE